MPHEKESMIDRINEAFGFGEERVDDDHDHSTASDDADRSTPERPDPAGPHSEEPIGGVSGATQASGSMGASGGMGASGAMGGAGAGGPVGTEPATGIGDPNEPAPGRAERTEYEMGHELDPAHEAVAESGVIAEREGTAVHDTWRDGEHEETSE